MATFLNRDKIKDCISSILRSAKKEAIMIVPYIKISENVFNSLKDAEQRGIHVIIVYRENQMIPKEREKLLGFKNITLLTHSFVHSKCYLNEDSMVVCSMNLYEYSENNNREMGILLSQNSWQDSDAISDGLKEVKDIVVSATIDRKAELFNNKPFAVDLFETDFELINTSKKEINQIFENKFFELELERETYFIVCNSYMDDVHAEIIYEPRTNSNGDRYLYSKRMTIKLAYKEDVFQRISNPIKDKKWVINGYDLYSNDFKKEIDVYRNSKIHPDWDKLSFEQQVSKLKIGLEKTMLFIKEQRLLVRQ